MDVSLLQRQFDTINVPKQTKNAILTVIDYKVNSEMKEILLKIDHVDKRIDLLEERMDQRFDFIDDQFKVVGERFNVVGQRFDTIEKQLSMMKWIIGIWAATITAFMTTMLLKG